MKMRRATPQERDAYWMERLPKLIASGAAKIVREERGVYLEHNGKRFTLHEQAVEVKPATQQETT